MSAEQANVLEQGVSDTAQYGAEGGYEEKALLYSEIEFYVTLTLATRPIKPP